MKVNTLLKDARAALRRAGIESYALDAYVLLQKAAGLTTVRILTEPELEISEAQAAVFAGYIKEREARRPVKQITQSCEFMGLDFFVNERVLIPRPETELLVERVLKRGAKNVLELGTGSGCIAVSLAALAPMAAVTAADISEKALEVASGNAKKHGVENRVCFLRSDLFENVCGRFDTIVSNPPYIETAEIENLERDVKDFEPRIALDGGADGLDFYRRIAKEAPGFLSEGGAVFLEIGYNQGAAVTELLAANGFMRVEITEDLAGLDRVVSAYRTNKGD